VEFSEESEARRGLHSIGAANAFSLVTGSISERITKYGSMEPKHAKTLTPAIFRHLLRVTAATSRFPERDTLILLLGITCGMRVTEIARIE
jgi:integrase